MRARFGIVHRLDFYDADSLTIIIRRSAEILNIPVDKDAAIELARRARGTPRIANRLLRRVRDFAEVRHQGEVTLEIAKEALQMLEVDEYGLDEIDRKLLTAVIERFSGGPVGVNALASSIAECLSASGRNGAPLEVAARMLARPLSETQMPGTVPL